MRKRRGLEWLGRFLLAGGMLACQKPHATGDAGRTTREPPTPVAFQSDSLGAEIRDISLGSDVWAVNRGEPSLAQYERSGRVVWHGVTRGEGPDQARTIWSVVAVADTAFAWDPLTRRLLKVVKGRITTKTTFAFETTHTIGGTAFGVVFGHLGRLRRWGDGWVTYATETPQWHAADVARMVILRFTEAGSIVDTVADFRGEGVTEMMAAQGAGPTELLPVPLWDVCQGKRFVLFDPDQQMLRWRTVGPEERDSLRLPFSPDAMPESFLRAHLLWQLRMASLDQLPLEQLEKDAKEMFPTARSRFGQQTIFAANLFCDATGRVWLQRFSPDAPPKGFAAQWLVIDLAAKQSTTAALPSGFQAMAADTSRIYGVVEDEGGVQSVATVPLAAILPMPTATAGVQRQ